MRMFVAMIVLWGLTILRGQVRYTLTTLAANRKALWLILGGAITGPFLGVTCSLYAVQNAPVGVASTLMALPPVILLPVGYYLFHERFGWQSIAGTLVAIAGVAMLFML
jgi:drug/metabolite transporter (DMT)-like permease